MLGDARLESGRFTYTHAANVEEDCLGRRLSRHFGYGYVESRCYREIMLLRGRRGHKDVPRSLADVEVWGNAFPIDAEAQCTSDEMDQRRWNTIDTASKGITIELLHFSIQVFSQSPSYLNICDLSP